MHDVRIRAGRHKACAKRIFKHVGRTPRVLADHDPGLFAKARAVVPAQKPPDLDRMIIGQDYICFSAKSVRPKILAQNNASSL